MRDGDFVRAWHISDGILAQRLARSEAQAHLPRHLQNIWNGQSLAGKHVLVRCYHGLGDTVQYIRFTRTLRTMARRVTVCAQPPLLPLIASAGGIDDIVPLHDRDPDVDYDVDIEIMELAHALRIDWGDLPGSMPYLNPSPERRLTTDPDRFSVGIVWSGGDWDTRRSIPFNELRPILQLPGIDFVSLQRGAARTQCISADILDASSEDVGAFASRLRELDLLVSVDTFAAHLGGALGVPVWLMLHSDPDWRWMSEGTNSPWYPTMRLFRQRRVGRWDDVIADVAASLSQYTSTQSTEKKQEQTYPPHVRPVSNLRSRGYGRR